MPFMPTVRGFRLLNISLRNNTFCVWDQLVGGWPLFSPPGTSIRHAGPGPEPKPDWGAEPRRWHRDRKSDPGPGHCSLVRGTGQIEGHTEGESVKVRHDSDTHAASLFWHLIRQRRRQEGGETLQGQTWKEERQQSESQSEKLQVSIADPLWHEH